MLVKVYVVVPYENGTGKPRGDPVGAKLTREAAQELAKSYAPAKVVVLKADKK